MPIPMRFISSGFKTIPPNCYIPAFFLFGCSVAIPIVRTFLISNMTPLAILTLGGVSLHSPSVLLPSWPNLAPDAGFKNLYRAARCLPTDPTSIIKGCNPSILPQIIEYSLGTNLPCYFYCSKAPEAPSPSSVTAGTAGFTKL
jgi:hypothetical protein